jgi:MFS family permease
VAGWEWIFFLNVPIAIGAVALAPVLLGESRVAGLGRQFDVAGALTVTGGLVLVVYALVGTNTDGWTSGRTLGLFGAAAALLISFLVIESRTRQPLLPLRFFSSGTITGANVAGFLMGSSIFSMFFFLSLYMQDVLGYSALRTGVAYLLVSITIIISATVSQMLVTRINPRFVLATGMGLLTLGLLWFTQVPVDGNYLVDLAPGFILTGIGLGFAFVSDTIAALAGVEERDAGVASGLINTSQQIGGAIGVAALVTVATSQTSDKLAAAGQAATDPSVIASASTDGFQLAFMWGAALAAFGVIATLALVRPKAEEQVSSELALSEAGD